MSGVSERFAKFVVSSKSGDLVLKVDIPESVSTVFVGHIENGTKDRLWFSCQIHNSNIYLSKNQDDDDLWCLHIFSENGVDGLTVGDISSIDLVRMLSSFDPEDELWHKDGVSFAYLNSSDMKPNARGAAVISDIDHESKGVGFSNGVSYSAKSVKSPDFESIKVDDVVLIEIGRGNGCFGSLVSMDKF